MVHSNFLELLSKILIPHDNTCSAVNNKYKLLTYKINLLNVMVVKM